MYQHLLLFEDIGTGEMLIIVLVIILLFGPKKIPELARGIGKGIRQFKDAANDMNREIRDNARAAANPIKEEKPQQVNDTELKKEEKDSKPLDQDAVDEQELRNSEKENFKAKYMGKEDKSSPQTEEKFGVKPPQGSKSQSSN